MYPTSKTSVLDSKRLRNSPKMPTAKNIRCTVHAKDEPLQEYHDNQSQSSVSSPITVYIQAGNASPFWIRCEVLKDYQYTLGDRISFRVYIDGNFAEGRVAEPKFPLINIRGVCHGNIIKRLKFSKLLLGIIFRS